MRPLRLLTSVRASADVAGERREEIVALAHGNPLAAVELARHPGIQVPPTVAVSVRQRLALADASAAKAASAAAVLGDAAGSRGLRAMLARLGVDAVDQAVDAAVRGGLLWPAKEGYGFAHPLEREAVYDAILPDERVALHAAAATVLAEGDRSLDRLAAVAAHWCEVGDDGAIMASSLAAASAAAAAGAYPEALAHQVRALASARGVNGMSISLDDETLRAAEFARWAGHSELGLRLLDERLAAPDCVQSLLWAKIGWLRREVGDITGAGIAYERAVACLAGTSNGIRAEVLAAVSTWHLVQGRDATALAACEDALALLQPGPSSARAHLLITRGVLLADSGNVETGLDLLEQGRRVALAATDEWALWRYVGNVTYVLENAGRPTDAVQIALRAYERARRAGVEHSLTVLPTAVNAVAALTELARFDEASTLAEHVLLGSPPGHWRALICASLSVARARQARPENAEELLAAAGDAAQDELDDLVQERIATAEAEVALAAGEPARARAAVTCAIEAASRFEDEDHLARALATAFRIEHGFGPDAGRMADLARKRLQWEIPTALHAQVCELEAVVESGSSSVDPEIVWSQIAEQADGVDPLLAGYARLRAGEAALARKDRRAASSSLWAAARTLAPTGTTFVAEQIKRVAALHHLAPGASVEIEETPNGARELGLTSREIEVLGMLVEGASNRQIARTLGMSEKTASVHVSHVIAKLGVSTRLEAATRAHRERLL